MSARTIQDIALEEIGGEFEAWRASGGDDNPGLGCAAWPAIPGAFFLCLSMGCPETTGILFEHDRRRRLFSCSFLHSFLGSVELEGPALSMAEEMYAEALAPWCDFEAAAGIWDDRPD